MKRHLKRRLLFLLAALLILSLWWGNNTISCEEYTFSSLRLPQGWDGARIVHLSDLHGKEFGRDHSTVVYAINQVTKNIGTDAKYKETIEDIIKNIRDN